MFHRTLLKKLYITSKNSREFYKYEGKLAITPIAVFLSVHAPHFTGKLLDVGCGAKPYKRYFSNVSEYVGVNLVPNEEVDIVCDAKNIPLADQSIDVILCNQVIEHDFAPGAVLSEIYRLLKSGGKLILSAPQMARLHGEPYDFYRYTKWGLIHLIENAGFKIELLESHGGFFRAWGSHWNFFLMENLGKGPLMKWLLRKIIININNLCFSGLDKLVKWNKDTLGYNVLAYKL